MLSSEAPTVAFVYFSEYVHMARYTHVQVFIAVIQARQQGKGGDSAPLLCSGVTPARVLRPALQPSAQERHGPGGVGPEEGHKNDQRAGAPLL